jgi:flagellar biosynthesis/type III secretory pathway protein FliH
MGGVDPVSSQGDVIIESCGQSIDAQLREQLFAR